MLRSVELGKLDGTGVNDGESDPPDTSGAEALDDPPVIFLASSDMFRSSVLDCFGKDQKAAAMYPAARSRFAHSNAAFFMESRFP